MQQINFSSITTINSLLIYIIKIHWHHRHANIKQWSVRQIGQKYNKLKKNCDMEPSWRFFLFLWIKEKIVTWNQAGVFAYFTPYFRFFKKVYIVSSFILIFSLYLLFQLLYRLWSGYSGKILAPPHDMLAVILCRIRNQLANDWVNNKDIA